MRLAVASNKGGVGKTATAVTIAAIRARAGRRVLLVDMDPQGSAGRALGVAVPRGAFGMGGVLVDGMHIVSAIGRPPAYAEGGHPLERLAIAPSSSYLGRLAWATDGIPPARGSVTPDALQRALEPVLGNFDDVVVDCPMGLSIHTMCALVACDALVVPVEAAADAVRAVHEGLEAIAEQRHATGGMAALLGILVTKRDLRVAHTLPIIEQLHEAYGDAVLSTQIGYDAQVPKASNADLPVILTAPRSRAAADYITLDRELTRRARRIGVPA